MHEVFGELDLEVRRVGELKSVSVSRKFEMNDLIA
jgi:hypothetical protein